MIPFRNRNVEEGQLVFVYHNLSKNTWSIRDVDSGLVIGYSDIITLNNAYFTVSEKGRQRMLRERVKNVHAGIIGEYHSSYIDNLNGLYEVIYNPYVYNSFIIKSTGDKIEKADIVKMKVANVWVKLDIDK